MHYFSTKLHYYSKPNITTLSKHHVKSPKFLRCAQQLNKKRCSKQSIRATFDPFDSSGDDFRAIMRIVKLNSAIQNRSVKEFFELACDECKYFCSSLPPIDFISFSKKSFVLLFALMARNNWSFDIVKLRIRLSEDERELEWTLGFDLNCNLHTSRSFNGNMVLSETNRHLLKLFCNIASPPEKLKEIIFEQIDKILPKGEEREVFINILINLILTALFYLVIHNNKEALL